MFKKIAFTSIILLLVSAAAGAYFYYVGIIAKDGIRKQLCTSIDVTFTDSLSTRLFSKEDIITFVEPFLVIGKVLDTLNIHTIEQKLDSVGGIIKSDVYKLHTGALGVSITERRPVVRLEGNGVKKYADRSGVLFPIISIVEVPIITGNISLEENNINGLVALAEYIYNDEQWSELIEQIDIEENGDICLYPKVGGQRIIFGDSRQIETKFRKLTAFYKGIVPQSGWDKYRTITLKYDNQIICK